jgi:hypothetical protein
VPPRRTHPDPLIPEPYQLPEQEPYELPADPKETPRSGSVVAIRCHPADLAEGWRPPYSAKAKKRQRSSNPKKATLSRPLRSPHLSATITRLDQLPRLPDEEAKSRDYTSAVGVIANAFFSSVHWARLSEAEAERIARAYRNGRPAVRKAILRELANLANRMTRQGDESARVVVALFEVLSEAA